MDRLAEWAHMGGYAIFIWTTYLLGGLVVGALVILSWRGLRQAERKLAEFEQLRPRRRRQSQ